MNDLIAHYGLPTPNVSNWYLKTSEIYFELEDTTTKEILFHVQKGIGMAKFSNPSALDMTIINYDRFITSVPDEAFKKYRERCDVIVCSNNNSCFILGEIKDRQPKTKVRSKAINQLYQSLATLLAVAGINNFVKAKLEKRCCYFNKQSSSPAGLTATAAFNRLPGIFPAGFKMNSPKIEAYGFEFYEYTGDQTITL